MTFSPKKHYFLDLLLFIAFAISAFTGMILGYISHHGGAYRGFSHGGAHLSPYTVLNLSRYTWKTIHTWSSFLLVFLVVIHLIAHRQWIASMTKKIFKSKN